MVLQDLLPPGVIAVVAAEEMWSTPASAAEEREVAGASPGRVAEFRAGRAAARRALSALGIVGHDIVRSNRRPVWPGGVVGAITHTGGYCAAAVARSTTYLGLGIDAERLDRPIEGGVRDRICSDDELAAAAAVEHAAHIIFSAKEAYYKTYEPVTGHWIGFEDARVTIDEHTGTFTVDLVSTDAPHPEGLTSVTGRYELADGLVISAITAPARR